MVLAFSSIAVIVTSLILKLNFKSDKEKVPNWLLYLTRRIILTPMCSKCKLCCVAKTQAKHSDSVRHISSNNYTSVRHISTINVTDATSDKIDMTSTNKVTPTDSISRDTGSTPDELEDTCITATQSVTCKDVAQLLDAFLFKVFSVLLAITTFIFMLILGVGDA